MTRLRPKTAIKGQKQEVQELGRWCLKQEQQWGRRLEKTKKPAALTTTGFTGAELKHRAGGFIARAKKTNKQTEFISCPMAFVISSSVTVDLFFVVQKPALRVGNNIKIN